MLNISDPHALALALVSGFFLIGGIVFLQSLSEISHGYASRHWPQAQATIVESRVEEEVNADGVFVFLPLVRYRYMVAGRVYESFNVRFPTRPFASYRRAHGIVKRYPRASSVLIVYYTTDPATSVLEPGPTGNAFMNGILGLVFLLGSTVGGYYFFFVHQFH